MTRFLLAGLDAAVTGSPVTPESNVRPEPKLTVTALLELQAQDKVLTLT